MRGEISIKSVAVSNLLSFGVEGIELDLEPLNVLVGPNGSGKSNFLEVFRLFQSLPYDLNQPFLRGGGIDHWQHKSSYGDLTTSLTITTTKADDVYIYTPYFALNEHELEFYVKDSRPYFRSEKITLIEAKNAGAIAENPENDKAILSNTFYAQIDYQKGIEFYSFNGRAQGATIAHFSEAEPGEKSPFRLSNNHIKSKDLRIDQSILSQRNDPSAYPTLHQLSTLYKSIHIFSETVFGRDSMARKPQDAALDSTFLFPDASNLALVLNDLQNQPSVMKTIIEKLKLFYERAENIITRVQGGTVQIFFQEEGLTQTVPASRLSDGTLRYLCLLVILCHPSPPPLICIEEPELGMHPDVLPTIAELLIEASQRTQLIITTHSDLLVSAIGGKHPEAIVVCEKGDNGTTMKRLEQEKMQEWLTRYSLGDLWLKGEIGGTRW